MSAVSACPVALASALEAKDTRSTRHYTKEEMMSSDPTSFPAQPADESDPVVAAPAIEPARRPFATLRRKTLLIVAVALVSLLVMLYIPLRIFLLGSFTALEEQMLRTDVQRAENALADELNALDTLNGGYAVWDDTYTFVVDRNETYIEQNTYDQFLIDTRLSLFLILDTKGQVVFSKAIDVVAQQEIPLPERFKRITPDDPLISATGAVTGVLMLPDGPMLIASYPILNSKGAGPVRGTMIMGRPLDAVEIQRLGRNLHLMLTFQRLDAPDLPDDMRAAQAAIGPGQASFVQPLSEQTIAAYMLIPDIDRTNNLMLRVETPRSIYAQGQTGIYSFMLSLLLAGLVFGTIMLALLEWAVLSRLAGLSTSVRRIGASSDLAARVDVVGDDELAHLARSINGMLAGLEHAQAEREQAEEARERVRLQEEALRAKREFLSIVSHELRTPLTPIMGFVDLLLLADEELTGDQRLLLQTIRSNTQRMVGLVDDLLEIGRIEAGNIELHFGSLDLGAAIADAVKLFQPEFERKELGLVQEIVVLPPLEADVKRIGQVLVNLISNAVKYTNPRGTITIRAFQRDDEHVEVQVEDTGVGLTPEQQANLFTPFYRADNGLRDYVSGTGLGLSIVKVFVDLHGGTVAVHSQVNVGSLFIFTLPIGRPPVPDSQQPAALAI